MEERSRLFFRSFKAYVSLQFVADSVMTNNEVVEAARKRNR